MGSALYFQDHRAYSPGDDPRHINWQAYARTGQYTMKLYREEFRPVVHLTSNYPAGPPQLELARRRSNAIRVLVSDLLFEGDPSPLIRSLNERQASGLIFCPFTRQEADREWTGHYDFIDAERGDHHSHQISPGVLTRYLASYRAHFGIWDELCRRHQLGFSRIAALPDLFTALHEEAVRSGLLELSP